MSTRVRPLADLLRVFVGPGLWFAHFTIVYGAEALICRAPGASAGRAMTMLGGAATVAVLLALAAFATILLRTRRATDSAASHAGANLLHGTALGLALVSAIGVIWTAFPLALLPVCVST